MTKISLCMITKDEGRNLENCLESVKDIADEIIIVDTGSKDNTKDVAKSFSANVIDFKWTNDFSEARNESLKHAKGDWILVLDGDEILDKEGIGQIKAAIEQGNDAYLAIIKNYSNNKNLSGFVNSPGEVRGVRYQGWYASLVVRLFRNKKFAFRGTVHELTEPIVQDAKISPSNIIVHHFGNADPKTVKKKRQFYLKLCKDKVKKFPNAKSYYELGVLYKETGDIKGAREAFEKAIELDAKNHQAFYEIGILSEKENNIDEAIGSYEKSNEIKKSSETLSRLGNCYLKRGDLVKAHKSIASALMINPKKFSLYNTFAAILEKGGNFKDAISALTISLSLNPNNPTAEYNLAIIYDKMQDFAKAVEHYQKAISLGHKDKEKIQTRIESLNQSDPDVSSFSYSFGFGE